MVKAIADLLQREEPVKWLFAGDSITHGALHTLGWRDFTEHFSERIRFELKRPRDFVIKSGISGWKITNLADDLDWNVLQFNADVVLMKFGMNDCTLGDEGLDLFRTTYIDVIGKIQASGSHVVLQTPNPVLDYAGAPRADNLAAYRTAVLEIADVCGVPLIDHYDRWTSRETIGTLQHLLVDGFHPNEYGHRALAHGLFEAFGMLDLDGSLTCQLLIPRLPG
jgi:lysophospholipase L1-like esterase